MHLICTPGFLLSMEGHLKKICTLLRPITTSLTICLARGRGLWFNIHMGVGGVVVNMGSSKGHERNSVLSMYLFYLSWWGSEVPSFFIVTVSRDRWSTSRILLVSLVLFSYYSSLWAAGIMGGTGLKSPGRKERWSICNDVCHQHSVFSVKLSPMSEIFRISYRNFDIILKVNISFLTQGI